MEQLGERKHEQHPDIPGPREPVSGEQRIAGRFQSVSRGERPESRTPCKPQHQGDRRRGEKYKKKSQERNRRMR